MKYFFKMILLISLVTQPTFASLLRPGFEGVRPTGMGDAFLALADDHNALFYNPAGLARVRQVHFHLLDFTLGADSDNTLTRLNNAVFKGDFEHLLRSDKEFLRMSFRPTLIIPYFGISFFQDAKGFFDLANPLNDGIDVFGQSDIGVNAGVGIPLGDLVSVGASTKIFQRTGADFTLTPAEIASDTNLITSILQGESYSLLKDLAKTGWAVGFNLGVLAQIPLDGNKKGGNKLQVGGVIENFGNTTFRELGSVNTPKSIPQSYNVGLAYSAVLSKSWIWNFTSDYKHLLEDIPFIKQFHLGTEFRHKVFGLRAGLNEGYITGGFSIEFPPHTRIHFSTYAKELGNSFNERQHRWYLLQLVIGFNPL